MRLSSGYWTGDDWRQFSNGVMDFVFVNPAFFLRNNNYKYIYLFFIKKNIICKNKKKIFPTFRVSCNSYLYVSNHFYEVLLPKSKKREYKIYFVLCSWWFSFWEIFKLKILNSNRDFHLKIHFHSIKLWEERRINTYVQNNTIDIIGKLAYAIKHLFVTILRYYYELSKQF